ncbi:hypothetical protein ACSRC8_20105, partial [Acinetobacter baumannii]|uniref:hypothetical protein n=1 Tax=Acinetobacter baumannii TaxID=470 RepID=UPI003ED8C702
LLFIGSSAKALKLWWQNERGLTDWSNEASTPKGVPLPFRRRGGTQGFPQNGTNYTVTAADLANGYITATLDATAADPVTGQIVIHAEAVDAQGNVDVADADVTLTIDT